MTCTQCSGTRFEPGLVTNTGRQKLAVEAQRCLGCEHLELFARRE